MPSPTEITVAQLARLNGTPAAPVIIDTCIDDDFALDPRTIPTAMRHPFRDVAALTPMLQGKRVVVYCQKGKKISQGAAAILRDAGIETETLAGGVVAWAAAGAPLVPAAPMPKRNAEGRTVWVTRQRPKIDRIACPWLIRRFVDPRAQFLFVASSDVLDVAEKFDATPFDIEGVAWSHKGEFCTFPNTHMCMSPVSAPAGQRVNFTKFRINAALTSYSVAARAGVVDSIAPLSSTAANRQKPEWRVKARIKLSLDPSPRILCAIGQTHWFGY